MGRLFIVSTPIGNLEDLSGRAARVLGEVSAVLAEDTRRTRILLSHLELTTPLLSLHQHNEAERTGEVLTRLEAGEELALVSDAGTPLISDPGERLLSRVIEEGQRVVPIPGPSAVFTALVGSGLPLRSFAFLGFPPRKGRSRREFLERVASSGETVVLFEAPERTGELLRELAEAGPPRRRGVVARELTKLHEEFRRGTLTELARYYEEDPPRGEVTVVVEAAPPPSSEEQVRVDGAAARALGTALLAEGQSPSRVAREVARRLGVPRNTAYELVQELSASTTSNPPRS